MATAHIKINMMNLKMALFRFGRAVLAGLCWARLMQRFIPVLFNPSLAVLCEAIWIVQANQIISVYMFVGNDLQV